MRMVQEAFRVFSQINVKSSQLDVPKGGVELEDALSLVFSIAGVIAVIVIAISGFRYVVSQGDPTNTAKAKNAIIYALIGLAVCVSAVTIVNFVGGRL